MDYERSTLSDFLVPTKRSKGAPQHRRTISDTQPALKPSLVNIQQIKVPQPATFDLFKHKNENKENLETRNNSVQHIEISPEPKPKHKKSKSQEYFASFQGIKTTGGLFEPKLSSSASITLPQQHCHTTPDLCLQVSNAEQSVFKLIKLQLDLQKRVDFQSWRLSRMQVAQSWQADHYRSLADFRNQQEKALDQAKQQVQAKKQRSRENLSQVLEQIRMDKHQKAYAIKQEKAFHKILIAQSRLEKQITRQTQIMRTLECQLQAGSPLRNSSKGQVLKDLYQTRLAQLKQLETQLMQRIEATLVENKQLLSKGRMSIPF